MAKKLPNNNGLMMFNVLVREVRDEYRRQGRTESWREIQKITSRKVYPKFKTVSYKTVEKKKIIQEVHVTLGFWKGATGCGSVFQVPVEDLSFFWFNLEAIFNLPSDVQIRINRGYIGKSRIDKVGGFSGDEIRDIINDAELRKHTDNSSDWSFEGYLSLVPNAKDDGSNCSYFVDFVLQDKGGVQVIGSDVEPVSPTKIVKLSGQKQKERETRIEKKRRELKELRIQRKREAKAKPKPKLTKAQKEEREKRRLEGVSTEDKDVLLAREKTRQMELKTKQIEALKEMREKGWLTNKELVEELKKLEKGGEI